MAASVSVSKSSAGPIRDSTAGKRRVLSLHPWLKPDAVQWMRAAEERDVGGQFRFVLVVVFMFLPAATEADESVGARVLVNTEERIVVQYELGRFIRRAIDITGREFTCITLGRESLVKERGAPALPTVVRMLSSFRITSFAATQSLSFPVNFTPSTFGHVI